MQLLANLIRLPPPGWGWLLHQCLTYSRYSLGRGIFLAGRLHQRWIGYRFMSSKLWLGRCWNASLFASTLWRLLTVTIKFDFLRCCFIVILFISIRIWIRRVLFTIHTHVRRPIFLLFAVPSRVLRCTVFSLNREQTWRFISFKLILRLCLGFVYLPIQRFGLWN